MEWDDAVELSTKSLAKRTDGESEWRIGRLHNGRHWLTKEALAHIVGPVASPEFDADAFDNMAEITADQFDDWEPVDPESAVDALARLLG